MRELPSTGPLLSSIIVGRAWTTATRRFRPGDTLLAVTDGVLETRDEHGTEFGAEGLLSAVAEVGLADGDRLIAAVAAASMRFGNNKPRRDDHTLLYLRRAPSEQAEPSGTVPTPIG